MNKNATDWSFQAIDFNVDYMRTVVLGNTILGNTLYCLSYHDESNCFSASDSLYTLPESILANPPLILSEFEMCGRGNDIFVYLPAYEACCGDRSENSNLFNSDELTRGSIITMVKWTSGFLYLLCM